MTLPIAPGLRVYLAPGATDMRKSFRGLMAATREVLQEDPLSGHLFEGFGSTSAVSNPGPVRATQPP